MIKVCYLWYIMSLYLVHHSSKKKKNKTIKSGRQKRSSRKRTRSRRSGATSSNPTAFRRISAGNASNASAVRRWSCSMSRVFASHSKQSRMYKGRSPVDVSARWAVTLRNRALSASDDGIGESFGSLNK